MSKRIVVFAEALASRHYLSDNSVSFNVFFPIIGQTYSIVLPLLAAREIKAGDTLNIEIDEEPFMKTHSIVRPCVVFAKKTLHQPDFVEIEE